MDLSPEDNLRLNVLLHNNIQAVRIDEPAMTLYAMTPAGEANIPLSPNMDADKYLQLVRDFLSTNAFGNPQAYPTYLKRWVRMEQTGHRQLGRLLLLAEIEAVIAVANSTDISCQLAELAWWCAANNVLQPEIASHLLAHDCVRQMALGQEISEYLLEYLPFTTDQEELLNYLIVILKSGRLSEQEVNMLWQRGAKKNIYLLAFLITNPRKLPINSQNHADFAGQVFLANNKISQIIEKTLSSSGQAFLSIIGKALGKVANEESVYPLLNVIGDWFADLKIADTERNFREYIRIVGDYNYDSEIKNYIKANPRSEKFIKPILILAGVNEKIAYDAILHSGAVGSQLRRKIKDIVDIINQEIENLQ